MASTPAKRKYPRNRPTVARGSNQRRIGRPEVTRAAEPIELGVLFDHFSVDDLAKRTASQAGRYGGAVLRVDPALRCTIFTEGTGPQRRAYAAQPLHIAGWFRVDDMENPLKGRRKLVDTIAEAVMQHLKDLREFDRAAKPRAA